LDGTDQNMSISGTDTLQLAQNTEFTIGARGTGALGTSPLNGSIANFRLFSKVLNADQVKELYDYQKDYFLGTRSSVTLYKGHLGIGVAEPSGQLELAGDERIQEYPPRGFGVFAEDPDYSTYIEGHGVFTAYGSSQNSTGKSYSVIGAFDKTVSPDSSCWLSGTFYSGGVPTSSAAKINGVSGEFIALKSPYPIKLKSFVTRVRNASSGENSRMAKSGIIWGSNDGSTWEQVHSWSGRVYSDTNNNNFEVNSTEYYSHHALQTTETQGNADATVLGEWRLFGTPGPTTLDKGSLTLGRSLDVPRISRYDVDTETPRPEKIVLDFDTTKMYEATTYPFSHLAIDNSGFRRNGNFRGAIGNYYSKPDKAFKFIGDGYLQTDTYIMSGNPPMSQSIWFKYTGAGIETLYTITAGYNTNTAFWVYVYEDVLYVDFSGNVVSFTDPNTGSSAIGPNQWYHLVVTYNGNSTIGGRRCYINGVEQVSSAVSGGAANGTLSLGFARVTLGALDVTATTGLHYMVGYLSNFKIYDAILEPSEVRKLYRLGRTGRSMVISDTAVGIGREPEVQLDVRGTVRFDNAYINNIHCPSLLAHQTCFGGGSVSYVNNRIKWNSDILCIPTHRDNGSGAQQHIRITMPANGATINYYNASGAHSAHTVNSDGIYLSAWQALWYTISRDTGVTSSPSQFMVMDYSSPRFPVLGTNSILIALRFGDTVDNELYFPSIRGRINI
jgi:hypothetical protein